MDEGAWRDSTDGEVKAGIDPDIDSKKFDNSDSADPVSALSGADGAVVLDAGETMRVEGAGDPAKSNIGAEATGGVATG